VGRQIAFRFGEKGLANPKVLGGKGAGLAELAKLGIPVPPGFSVTTGVWRAYWQHDCLPKRVASQMRWQMAALERATGRRFGCASAPLLVSVRSGAPVSMPGMMDTVLNLGLNEQTVAELAKSVGCRAAWDCYRRFLQLYGSVVLAVPRKCFEEVVDDHKLAVNLFEDSELPAATWQSVCEQFHKLIQDKTNGQSVPSCPWQQLTQATTAVLRSWDNPRAREYRRVHKIADSLGTAVNVQTMVFGNVGDDSGTGVVFSRNCSTGAPGLWGEFLSNAQGEDVVAGTSTPLPVDRMKEWNPAVYSQLAEIVKLLEDRRKHTVDVEFTVERGKLYILQVRAAKLTPEAAITIATHFVWEQLITKEEALKRVSAEELTAVEDKTFAPLKLAEAVGTRLIARGLPASPGAAVGKVVLSSEAAVSAASRGEQVILVRPDTSPDDLSGMIAACAIVTATGGATSHAAVVARGLGKPAVTNCGMVNVREGETVSVDGASGVVVSGEVERAGSTLKKEINIFLRWQATRDRESYQPKLCFGAFSQKANYNQMINEFYLTDAMAREAAGSKLSAKANQLKNEVHKDVAERMAMYLVVAIGGELRHLVSWKRKEQGVTELLTEYKIQLSGPRNAAQVASIESLRSMSTSRHVRFLELAAMVFERCFAGSFGGMPWANIARAALQFLTGKLNMTVFTDHAFDLQHNSGRVFGKHSMLTGEGSITERQLEGKKHATGVDELIPLGIGCHNRWSPKVLALCRAGREHGIWSSFYIDRMRSC
jgi:phosphohistidine swiveling domain-containing protein